MAKKHGKDNRKQKGKDGKAAGCEAEPEPAKRNQRGKDKKNGKPRRGGRKEHAYGQDDLATELSLVGLRVKEVAADGNCFFRSLCDQLEGDSGDHAAMRRRVVGHIVANREEYAPFVEDDETFDSYAKRMGQDGTWAGHMELQAASRELGVNIRVYQAGQPIWTIKNHGEDAPVLHLSYHDGMHFNSVRAADDWGAGPPTPLALTHTATDPAQLPALCGQGFSELEVDAVLAGTGCGDRSLAKAALQAHSGGVDAAIEALIEQLAQAEEINGQANGTGIEVQQQQQQPERQPGKPSDAQHVSSDRSKQPLTLQRQQVQHPSSQAAASCVEQATRGPCTLSPQDHVVLELHVREDRVAATLQLQALAAGHAPELVAAAGSGPGLPSCSDSGDEARLPHQQPLRESAQYARRNGIKVALGGPARRNKPCACGSNQKWKNCCGRRGRGGNPTAGAERSGGVAKDVKTAVAQLQELFI